jgi:hypothetical protein
MFSAFFKNAPFKLNPLISLVALFVLAFIPHILKGVEVKKKLKAEGKPYSIANSRIQTAINFESG